MEKPLVADFNAPDQSPSKTLFTVVATASILAKTHRDDYMVNLDVNFPQYGWKQNKGYPTIAHRRAIFEHGKTPHHRTSFKLLPDAKQGALFG